MLTESDTPGKSIAHVAAVMVLATLTLSGCDTYRTCKPEIMPAATDPQPPRECRVDGCSLAPDFDFRDCCDGHDARYWVGGTREERRQVDRQFRQCIAERDHSILSQVYYVGVRLGGTPYLPTPWRWGFGWEYTRGYTKESSPPP